MILDRGKFSNMLKFMLAVMPKGAKTGRNCLFVKVEDGNCIFTAGGEHCVKRVIIPSQNTTTSVLEDRKRARDKTWVMPETFMIPRGFVAAFVQVLSDHKSICKKLGKNEPSYQFIEMDGDELESIGEYVHFSQPKFQFKNLQPFFEQKQVDVFDSIVMPGEISNAMNGFSKTSQVVSSYRIMETDGKKSNLIHFTQPSTEFEAVFICPPEAIKKGE